MVTGASKGIGAGIAKRLAAAGASVAVNYVSDRHEAEATVAAITAADGRNDFGLWRSALDRDSAEGWGKKEKEKL